MNQERFEQKMQRLEKEREEFISHLSSERQQKFRQKEEEFNQQNVRNDKAALNQQILQF